MPGKLMSPFENLTKSLGGSGDDDSKDSFECLYIDETGEGPKGNRAANSSKWDTDSSIVSSESQGSHQRRHKKSDKDRKHRHKSKHKRKELEKIDSKHKHKHRNNKDDGKRSDKRDSKQSRNASLNDALAGALDGMEELIQSSNYAERVSQSKYVEI